MAVFAKKLNSKQRRMLQKYENITGFEPMHQEELDSGEMTFSELWYNNVHFIESIYCDVVNIRESGSGV